MIRFLKRISRMGARTRRVIFIRLMAVCAICSMAIGHLLFSMTAGLDGYARLHMSVLAPSATSHKELDVLMRKRLEQRAGGRAGGGRDIIHMEQNKIDNILRCSSPNRGKSSNCKDLQINGFPTWVDYTTLGAKNPSNIMHIQHCPQLKVDFSKLMEVIKAKGSSPWQATSPGNLSYVHSAHYDGRGKKGRSGVGGGQGEGRAWTRSRGNVAVIGVVKNIKAGRLPLFCQLWYPERGKDGIKDKWDDDGEKEEEEDRRERDNGIITIRHSPTVVRLKALRLDDGNNSRSAAFLYTCPLPTRQQPLGVSLVEDACSTPSNYLATVTPPFPKVKVEFTVCVPMLKPDFQSVGALLQMVEINRMFGIDKFIFYVHTTGRNVKRHMRKYIADNIALKVAYKFPLKMTEMRQEIGEKIGTDLYNSLKVASANDCLYRNMFKTKYLIFANPDELLVPRGFKKLHEMLNEVTEGLPQKAPDRTPQVFRLKSVIFRTEWPDNPRTAGNLQLQRLDLYSLLKTNREPIGLPGRDKPAFIVRTTDVIALGPGKAWDTNKKMIQEINVPESLGLVHIFRHGCRKDEQMEGTVNPGSLRMISDNTMLAFYDVILARILKQGKSVNPQFPNG